MKFIFSIPGFDSKSNGLNVFHCLAREFQKLGAEVRIIPWSLNDSIYEVPEEYKDLYTARFDLSDAVAFLPDAIPGDIAEKIKAQTKCCVWWLCNVPGLLGHMPYPFGGNDLLFAYSKLISSHLPQLYYHSDNSGIPSIAEITEKRKKADLVLIYTGKGRICPIPQLIAERLPDSSKIVYISRFFPETKEMLYSLLMRSKFVISFDPISNLNYEATLLGAPVFLVNHMRPNLNLQRDFNIPLHGFFTNQKEFIYTSKIGLDLEVIHNTHKKALETNSQRVEKAYNFIKNWSDASDSIFSEFQAKITPMYSKIVQYELPDLKKTIDCHVGSIRVLSEDQDLYLKTCVENPKLITTKIKRTLSQRLKRSFNKKLKKLSLH